MVRGAKVGHRSNFKKRVRSKGEGSDDSDEDYVVSEEGNEESDDDAEDYCSSLDECASEEGFGSFVDDEDEEEVKEVRKVVRSKAKRMSSARNRKIVDRKSRKRKSVSDEEEEDEDYEEEEEDEDDDEEFTLDEEDCLDEEEELTIEKKKNNMKVSKQGLQKRGPSKHRKKMKSAVSKKPLRKGGRKKRRLKRKKRVEEEDDDDWDFIDNAPIVRKKCRTNAGRRMKAYVVPSDSDFVLSGSSDYEYTISEEEREQVKEANQLCGSFKASLLSSSSSKRIPEVEELGQHKKPPGRKGKEKVEETKAEVMKPVCGICLSEEDKRRLRGTLNCCSHYFCFTCIMEWSKVESRCPICKQRFETISKPARSTAGADLRDVVIQVPKRDQVYQPSEEELRSYLDPYENVICSECHQGGDDELMLLCDLCDSSAHTYCVGLGREVPEGNWYCDGCRPVALGSPSSQVQDSLPDQRTINSLYNRLSPIVNLGESLDSIVVPSPRTPLHSGFVGLSSPRFPVVDIPAVSPISGVGAPTLTGRRWLHRQIQNLRSINRMNLMAGRTDGISTANMGIDFVNSHIDRSRETTVQQPRTQDMGTQHQTVFEERLQDDPSSSLQSRDFFSSRLGHLRRQAVQDSTTTTFNNSVNLTLWPELAGISSNEQLNQCSNGSNIGPDGCGSPFPVRNEDNFFMAKEQLQGMVRSHLKALSNDIDLDNGTFKDIATSSMHTLLAACGLEHRRNEVHIVPPPLNCTHIERLAAGGQASLMKGNEYRGSVTFLCWKLITVIRT
ncbi:remodeling and spacing factor 1-like isoform X2 [Durio zibethinus]|uniref:Remodeling and spacing factor 1-like isoform X2 n=1 Tax=Durio zibethinus TaxID=66656 RepID=A0A6P5WTP4_DURZI|nr:remodeling and spacing factor 1-like isoform X2 [Durio zibethinus]